jgi:hypothetical protein
MNEPIAGPVDCNGVAISEGDVCRIVTAAPGFESYIGVFVTVVELVPPFTETMAHDDGEIVMGMILEWCVYAESSDLPPCPMGPEQNWLFPGEALQKMFGPSVDMGDDTDTDKDKEKETDDVLPA